MKWEFALKRRKFLISAGACSVALGAFGAAWIAKRWRPSDAAEPEAKDATNAADHGANHPASDATVEHEPNAKTRTTSNASTDEEAPAIPPETIPLLLVVADVIVPRYGDSPAASEIDLLPRLQRLIDASPALARTYRKDWVKLAKIIHDEVPVVDGKPEPKELARHLRIYHRRFRRTKSGGDLGNGFEQLRRDVLSIYYTSPEGRAWVGYSGRRAGHGESTS